MPTVAKKRFFLLELEWRVRFFALFCGGFVGLAAPGFDQWYIPWFCMVSLLLLTVTSREPWSAALRGFYFGFGYNLVYLSWFLTFRPVYCQGTFVFCHQVVVLAFWLLVSAAEGAFTGIFSCFMRALPLVAGWLPSKHQGRWRWPAFFVVPFLWMLVDRLCNTTQLLGFPWSAVQYSQCQQLVVLQSASLIGGTGIAAWIMLVNTTLLSLLLRNAWFKSVLSWIFARDLTSESLLPFIFGTDMKLAAHSVVTLLICSVLLVFGCKRLELERALLATKQKVTVSAVQAGVSPKTHKVSDAFVYYKYFELIAKAPAGTICVLPEWVFPLDFSKDQDLFSNTATRAKRDGQSWVFGCFDNDKVGRKFNSVSAIAASGAVLPVVYHKRYLVPVGEYTPDWIRESPAGVILYGADKKYRDTSSGERPVIFDLGKAKIAPVICFECAYPKLCAQSIRAGGQLITDSSDNSWFERSILSNQMVGFCVMRAVENHRSFVFSTALGPSAIIDSSGHILQLAPLEAPAVITSEVPVENDTTLFTRWCF
ncbi:MAG: apolipoprotein N-acyltransferase [Candidatus Obscuribacterales bacterium]